MEIIKHKILGFLLLGIFMIRAGSISAQDYKVLQEAFVASYAYENNSNFPKAIDALKKVYDTQSYEINVRLGWLCYNAGNHNESTMYYSRAIQLKPYSIESRFGYVLPASAMGNWNQVLKMYIEILKIDDNNYTANYRMGLIYYNRKDYAAAYKNFEKLANLYPFDYDATHMYAWTNYRLGKFREAKILFNKTLLIKPGDASALEGLGLIN